MDFDVYSLTRLLQFCSNHHSILQGKQLHLLFLKKGILNSAVTIGNRLLQMYIKCGSLSDARSLFEEMPLKNCYSWNTLIEGYMKSGEHEESLALFHNMSEKNDYSWNVVVSGYAKLGLLDIARSLFNSMHRKNEIVWTSMIHGYAHYGFPTEALRLFKSLASNPFEVSRGDTFVLATVMRVSADLFALGCGKQIHARIVMDDLEFDKVLASSLVNVYCKCGDLKSANNVLNMMNELDDYSLSALTLAYASCGQMREASRVFHMKDNPDVALWNSLISGYVCNNENMGALFLFNEMRTNGILGDSLTLASIFSACSILGILEYAKQMHTHACKVGFIDNIVVSSALLDAYSKCGSPDDACKLFSELKSFDTIMLNCMITIYSSCGKIEDAKNIFKSMPCKSLVSWNSIIAGLSQNSCPIEALNLFRQMNQVGLKMDKFSVASVISACAGISSLTYGEQVFARATIIGLDFDEIVANTLVDFYCKCGLVENGRKLFENMVKIDEVPWNSMLMGYATNGYGFEALEVFNEMKQACVMPNNITFTAVLSACDHCGLVEEARDYFYLMKSEYHIDPTIEHYTCMTDLFSRAGCLEEAMNLIEEMPFKADANMLSSVLRGCVDHGHRALGKKVAERMIELDSGNSAAYVQLCNIFTSAGDWDQSAEVRTMMKYKRVEKNLGCSWASC